MQCAPALGTWKGRAGCAAEESSSLVNVLAAVACNEGKGAGEEEEEEAPRVWWSKVQGGEGEGGAAAGRNMVDVRGLLSQEVPNLRCDV